MLISWVWTRTDRKVLVLKAIVREVTATRMVKVLTLKETEDRISKDRMVSRKVRAVLLRAAVQTNMVRMDSSLETDLKEMVLRISKDRTVSSPVLQKVIAMALVSKDSLESSLVVPMETVRARMETAISLVRSPVKALTVRTETATRTVLHKTASLF